MKAVSRIVGTEGWAVTKFEFAVYNATIMPADPCAANIEVSWVWNERGDRVEERCRTLPGPTHIMINTFGV